MHTPGPARCSGPTTSPIWGGLDEAPVQAIADEIAHRLADGRFHASGVDYIVILNSHRRGAAPAWTTEAVVVQVRHEAPAPETMTWPQGVVSWRLLRR